MYYLQFIIFVIWTANSLGQYSCQPRCACPCQCNQATNHQHLTYYNNGFNGQLTRKSFMPPAARRGNQLNKALIEIHYQAFCDLSRSVYAHHLLPVVNFLKDYIDVHTYPSAVMTEYVGVVDFQCKHGAEECYASKLHLCAIDLLGNVTGVLFNACTMDEDKGDHGSDDLAVERCAVEHAVNADSIKQCAKGDKGGLLLENKTQEAEELRARPTKVPYVLINGKEAHNHGQKLFIDVCEALNKVPKECENLV